VYALVAALGNVIGALAVTRRAARGLAVIEHFVAFGAGFMLAVALIEVLPEAFARSGAAAPGLVLAGYLAVRWGLTSQWVPFDGRHPITGWIIIVVSALAVAAGSNAFNLTDGSDGLAAGAGAITFGALAVIAVLQHRPSAGLMAAVLAGILVGFLFYNLYPARIFMGDTGSLALGTAMAAAAIATGFLWYLPLLALVFVVETISVIAQVASFKMTGRRVIKMSPLHNHFIVSGWRETPLALWFWAGSLVAAALVLALARPGAPA